MLAGMVHARRGWLAGRRFRALSIASVILVVGLAAALATVPLGTKVRVSDMGPDGNIMFGPIGLSGNSLAYNSTQDEYLAVWAADDTTDGEFEVWGRRVNAAGVPLGTKFRISDIGV